MPYSIGVDPDTHRLAVACVRGPAPFRLAGWWQAAVKPDLVGEAAVLETLSQLTGLCNRWVFQGGSETIVIESQAVYPDTVLGVSGLNGLLRLAQTAGAAAALLREHNPGSRILMPQPFEWKGNVPKAAHHRRIRELLDDESKASLAGLPEGAAGHIMDAIGLAMWAQEAGGAAAVARRDITADARARAKQIRAARRRA